MSIQTQGFSGVVDEVESASRARRMTARPTDPGALGAYSLAIDNGTTAMTAGLAANSPIFSWRWGNASNLAILRSIRMSAYVSSTGFTAGRFSFDALWARSFTASDTGGTAVTLTGNNMKKRTSFGTTLLTDARFSTTATLTAGTRTLDAAPFGKIHGVIDTGTNKQLIAGHYIPLWQRDTSEEYPMVFAQNEGVVVQATVPATGIWFWSLMIEWMELASF